MGAGGLEYYLVSGQWLSAGTHRSRDWGNPSAAGGAGVASEPSPDVQQSTTEHIAWLNQALDKLPILVVLDNVQIGGEQPAWGAFLAQIAQGWRCSRLLLSGRTLPTRLDNTLLLHGLDEGAARTFYTQTWRPTSDAEWATIYRLSHGIPALLALIDAPTPASRIMPETARRLLHDSLSTFEANERAVLIWLSWWEGPLRHDHPFVQPLRRGSALERLIQQHIVTLTNDHLAVHDSVRDHLQILVPAAEWAAGTQAVEVYAVAHQEWQLAYRCAENRRDLGAQWRYSREMALHLERTQHTIPGRSPGGDAPRNGRARSMIARAIMMQSWPRSNVYW